MKNKAALLALLLALCVHLGYAQTRTVSGVIKSADGETLPGVAVLEKGTRNGVSTDFDGKFTITLTSENPILVFQAIGQETKEVIVGSEDFINVQMEEATEKLDEVVITALGISRDKKSVGYSVQEVGGEELSEAREVNIANSLSGRLAGVQVNSATGSMGGSSRILIRGATSINNNDNQPLFVLDGIPLDNSNFTSTDQERGAGGYDYGNAIQDINPDDIESMSVLKGAAATALYGSRGANGVILVTTKKGKSAGKGKGIGVSYKFGVSMEKVYILPDYQNEYGGGFGFDTLWYSDDPSAFGSRGAGTYQGVNGGVSDSYDLLAQYAVDESWGPRLNGQQVRHWWSWDEGHPDYGKTAPWEAHPDNVRNFFNTGYTFNNSIALYNATERSSFRLSYNNLNQTGVFPNSEIKRNNLSFNGSTKLTDKLSTRIGVNYAKTNATGRPGTGYDANNVMQQFNQWGQRQWSDEKMEDYKLENGDQRTWNRISYSNGDPQYTDNPYWTRYENYQNDTRERVFGNINLNYAFNDKLSVDGTAMTDFYNDVREERIAINSQEVPMYELATRYVQESNYEGKINYNTRFNDDFGLVAILGGNIRNNTYRRFIGTTEGGLNALDFYNLSNSVAPAVTDQYTEFKRVSSVFASTSWDYKNMLYVDLTYRIDWSSALPEENRMFDYPSVSGSFVFTELEAFRGNNVLSFGKLRAGWAAVGNDTDPYQYYKSYDINPSIAGNASVSNKDLLPNPDLLAEETSQWEVGTDIRFFKNRLRLDFTYYHSRSYNQILELPISASTGSLRKLINAGEMENSGIEIMLAGDIIKPANRGDFQWTMAVNFAKNENKIIKLYEDEEQGIHITNYLIAQAPFAVSVQAVEGESYGSIYGYAYKTDAAGNRLVDATGAYVRSDQQEVIGDVLPDFTGGVTNSFSYKGVSLSALIDFQVGGDVFSTTNMWGKYTGVLEETAADGIRENGTVVEGVYAPGTMLDLDGDGTAEDVGGRTNQTNISAQDHFFYNGGYTIGEADVYDAGYVYLREVTLSYALPEKIIEDWKIQKVTFGLFGRNLWLIHSNIPHLDPTALANSATNAQGLEGAALPSIRSFGFNVSFNF
ncbi:TonB-linked outer membrane protein, SusC/RagA family [Owenweeksia hongkongensis DSM 17368]|uniref:TonB-linked outer membrane protein, SusC/RagA family n=1 Tax=Owenweeksia hongkongensis (strain DSM 17368 / CIP 108786 / JCM 12287 / NRRL B-23963 / UST20020801) TaxID=926562 RepID=G8R1P7_OWEHD|nr:SusC/RagA family TonB-linked outer membrane protein [Owenweeksia hongkongensis]AEV32823.1 TonB-linked outer membrane protein, SusC/RagA family [Owenweeksia hongkongensis DSM 17368]